MKKIKVGIMTFWGPVNYGAYLQAYALSSRLNQEENIEAELINFRTPGEIDYYRGFLKPEKNIFKWIFNLRRYHMFGQQKKYLPLSGETVVSDSIEAFTRFVQGRYDVIVAGSDEVWKIGDMRGYPNPYFLFDRISDRKFSYAASSRTSFSQLSAEQLEELRANFQQFDYIGVRDTDTYNSLTELIGSSEKLHYNLDPTFMYGFKPDKARGREILKNRFHVDISKKCIGVMYSELRPSKPVVAGYIREQFGDAVEIISLYEWCPCAVNTPELSPFDWIDVIAALDCVISMYFHAICFSLIAHTPFFAIESRADCDARSKIFDLLNRFDLTQHYFLGLNNAIQSGKLRDFIDSCDTIVFDTEAVIKQAEDEFERFVGMINEV